MRTDIERAAQIVRTATEFDWTWTAADLPAFSDLVGWQLTGLDQTYPELTTDLDVNRRDTMLSVDNTVGTGDSRPLNHIWFRTTDVILDDTNLKPEIDRVFDELAQRVFEVLGRRADEWWVEPTRGLRWHLPTIAVAVTTSARTVYVELVSPEYQRWQDKIEADGDE
ncbi:DUF6301 family protein [Nocardia pseudobrasiliensis]|nr:DUF6301 family protein [Nocardia pseudobrasiliensis]